MNYNSIEILNKANENCITCDRHTFLRKNIHWHSYYELELVIRGKGKHNINGTSYPFQAGDVFLLRPSEFHEFELEEEGETYLIEIPSALFPMEVLELIICSNQNLIVRLEEERFDILKNLYYLLEYYTQKEGNFNAAIIPHLLSSLLLLFLDNLQADEIRQTQKGDNRLMEIIIYIHQNFCKDITLESISALFYINKEYLSARFGLEMGMSLTAYIRRLRLRHAARLAVTTNMKSIEIAESCGFNSVQTFMRSFKQEYGVSLLEMRKNSKK